MKRHRSIAALTVCAALLGACAQVADAQDRPSANRGSAKVRARSFNPFDVSQSRLTINPFGFITLGPANAIPAAEPVPSPTGSNVSPPVPVSGPAGASLPVAPAPSEPTAATSSTAGGGSAEAAPGEKSTGGSGEAVRPPFRPPVRSPFRPPPRPPF